MEHRPSQHRLGEIATATGLRLSPIRRLAGGEQGGAWLVAAGDGETLVLKLQRDPAKTVALVRAAPVVVRAVRQGWRSAQWRHWGVLSDGSGFLLQQYLRGESVGTLDRTFMAAVVEANATQAGLASDDAVDDSAQLGAVTIGAHPWRDAVRTHSREGAELVRQSSGLLDALGPTPLPDGDLVHGDYSSSNMIIDGDGRVQFVDSETVGRGTRVRDLADLYRQCIVYPGTPPEATGYLLEQACAISGAAVFLTCVLAVAYNNLAWWVEHRPVADFDTACRRLRSWLDEVEGSVRAGRW